MRRSEVLERVVGATLYEGYLLYPYRRSVKNQMRWNFGVLYPRSYQEEHPEADLWQMRTECLLVPEAGCRLEVEARFLQILERSGEIGDSWQEATEQQSGVIALEGLGPQSERTVVGAVDLAGGESLEPGVRRRWWPLQGMVTTAVAPIGRGALRVTVTVSNLTVLAPGAAREVALRQAMVSTHTVLQVGAGRFVAMTDPPSELAAAVAECHNLGTWPVLVGEDQSADTVLSSPIVLEDHPRIAAESPGDLFDATEIDELLSLSILAMGDEERSEMRRTDPRSAALLQRTEALTQEQFMQMHGRLRALRPRQGDDHA